MISRAARRLLGALSALPLLLAPVDAHAVSASDAPDVAARAVANVDRETDSVRDAIAKSRASERTPETRLADAELLLRQRDFARAIGAYHEIVEKYPAHPTVFPEALTNLGEAYYQAKQLLSARRTFKEVLDKAGESRMAPYVPRAYARLVDIALRLQNPKDIDELLSRMGSSTADATLQYAKSKALLAKRDFPGAKAAALAVPAGHALHHQSRYVVGVITMREALAQVPPTPPGEKPQPAPPTRFAAAIDAFKQVTSLPPDTPEHRKVIDLAWMAAGRLFYEADQWFDAIDAYNHVDRQSPDFGTALYELAWVYVRLGDADRASRALEVLTVADPNNSLMAEATLLRADLMLRAGKFDQSLAAYQSIRAEYDPMRERVDAFLGSTSDPAVYYDRLLAEQVDSGAQATVPQLAIEWARQEADGPAAFALIDDIAQCRELIRQSQILVSKLRVILTSPARVRAFPELKAGDERALSLLNRVTQARLTVAQGLDDAEPRDVSGELATARDRRRELQKRVKMMPVTDGDFTEREQSAQRQWNKVGQKLQQLQLEVDQLHAIVNGLRRMITEGQVSGKDPATVSQWKTELEQNERDLRIYRDTLETTRRQIDLGRVQVGYGDARFQEDEEVRVAFKQALQEELRLAAGGAGGSAAQAYAGRVGGVMSSADASEAKLLGIRKDIDAEVSKKVAEVQVVIDKEATAIAGYEQRLGALDQESRIVVGQVAMRNFGLVRDKLRGLVMRADVGSVDQAWEVREEQMTRVRNLQIERVREEQLLQQELREVLDDQTDADGSGGAAPSPDK
ncbi:MAG: tetratricopeptide repeat protein [Polyangiaceae bacterium]|nr:tetratricopeptide repeat protein [Polyangiaceae bacterium]